MDYSVIHIVNNLRAIRESLGLTQAELSDLSGVYLRTIQSYEQGTRSIILASYFNLFKLSVALKCSVSDIVYIC